MARVYLFSDEAGDFTFRRAPGASLNFLIATVRTNDCGEGDRLRALQRDLAWRGKVLERFHAVDDRPAVRHEVYELMAGSDLRIDATVLYKPKAQPHVRANPAYFYKLATFLHFKYVIPRVTSSSDDLMVVASSLQIKRKKAALSTAVRDVVSQVSPTRRFVTAFHNNATDPCLQLADYAAWAIQRKVELGDDAWLEIIRDRVITIFKPFDVGTTEYY